MSGEIMDDLQQLWRNTNRLSEREANLMTNLIREKGSAAPEIIRLRNRGAIIMGVTVALFVFPAARAAGWPWIGPGNALIGLSTLAAAIILGIHQQRHKAPDSSVELSLYCQQLLRYYDLQIRVSRILRYVCMPVLCGGLALVGWGFFRQSGSIVAGILCGVAIALTIFGRNMRRIGEFRDQRNRIELLLAEIGSAPGNLAAPRP